MYHSHSKNARFNHILSKGSNPPKLKNRPYIFERELPRPTRPAKRKRKSTPVGCKRGCLTIHAGPHAKSMTCLGCGVETVEFTKRAGWDASHIVADKYFGDVTLSKYDLVPLCSQCNQDMDTMCFWEWILDVRGRTTQFKEAAYKIFKAYNQEHVSEQVESCWELVLVKLHGSTRFPKEAIIQDERCFKNAKRILKSHQFEKLQERTRKLNQEIIEIRQLMSRLT